MKSVHHAITGKQVVVPARAEALVGAIAVEAALQFGGDFALHHQIVGITLHLEGPPGKLQEGIIGGHWLGHGVPLGLSGKGVNSSATIKISQFCLFLKSAFADVCIKLFALTKCRCNYDAPDQCDVNYKKYYW
jgi:hypothetical protein